MNVGGWGAVDELLNLLAERNPNFRVVFKGDFCRNVGGDPNIDEIRSIIEVLFPLVSSKGLVKFERVSHVENRFWKLGAL